MPTSYKLRLLPEKFSINKLPQFEELPHIFAKGDNCFIVRTDKELSIICPEYMAPNSVQQVGGWRCIRISGDHDLSEVGVLASILNPLAEAGISILAFSSFETDHIFIMEENLVEAVQALQKAGHQFLHSEIPAS
ncbi:MAG: ACT domain-containing protein [Ignavibacteria bacterium]|nr:ACT domain-containing protein [Ignavibacteria bacterium]